MPGLATLDNRSARRLFLQLHGLGDAATGSGRGQDLMDVIQRLGFVQIDSINTVERAHHMILHARRTRYRPRHLTPLLHHERALFEHWTHDASIIPTEFFGHWHHRFDQFARDLRRRWSDGPRADFARQIDPVLDHIRQHGPCGTGDLAPSEPRNSGGWWEWNPTKTALEYLWLTGVLSVTRREKFRKIYDLTDRVIPANRREQRTTRAQTVDWACNAAIDRLGFATSGEIAAFWAKVSPAEAATWCKAAVGRGALIEIDVTCADGSTRRCLARPGVRQAAAAAPDPPGGMRVLSPFDPALRDRARSERLFGFDYRIEVFVPAAKRRYGYYVFPVLEGDRIAGRIDMKCQRQKDRLHVTAFWPEPGVRMGKNRLARLEAAVDRTRRFAGMGQLSYEAGWLRDQRQ